MVSKAPLSLLSSEKLAQVKLLFIVFGREETKTKNPPNGGSFVVPIFGIWNSLAEQSLRFMDTPILYMRIYNIDATTSRLALYPRIITFLCYEVKAKALLFGLPHATM